MPAPISVIIPTLNAADCLNDCLAALFEGVEAQLISEVIVTDGGSDDQTQEIAQEWGCTIINGPRSRGGQLRRGCARAKSAWFLIVHADTQLAPGWSQHVRAHLSSNQAGYFKLRFDKGGALVARCANLRARLLGLPYGDQGLLIANTRYHHIGGYRDIPIMEDVSLISQLRGNLTEMDSFAITSAQKYRDKGWIKQITKNAWCLSRFLLGVSPEKIAKSYYRKNN